MSKRIRAGDKVYITAGNDKGKIGKVLHKADEKVLVEGINIRTKHQKPQGQNKQGQILKVEAPIHVSNVKLCVNESKACKVKLVKTSRKEKELVYELDGKQKVYRKLLKPAKIK